MHACKVQKRVVNYVMIGLSQCHYNYSYFALSSRLFNFIRRLRNRWLQFFALKVWFKNVNTTDHTDSYSNEQLAHWKLSSQHTSLSRLFKINPVIT